jgi:hypothetical protein
MTTRDTTGAGLGPVGNLAFRPGCRGTTLVQVEKAPGRMPGAFIQHLTAIYPVPSSCSHLRMTSSADVALEE